MAKEVWHFPKRCSAHQMVGSLNILNSESIDNVSWNAMRKETFNTRLSQWGFTRNGRPLALSARRTLEGMLKYLGLIFVIKKGGRQIIYISDVGRSLIGVNPTTRPRGRGRITLGDTIRAHPQWQELDIVREQLKKLIITNPVINEDCINILVFPFRETLRLLIDPCIAFLTLCELGYIVFSMRESEEYELIKQRIINFRALSPADRNREISAFERTPIGNITIKQAPTAKYYMNLCEITGLCKTEGSGRNTKLMIKPEKEMEIREYLGKYNDVRAYNFQDNLQLWVSYFGKPDRIYPPKDVKFVLSDPDEYGLAISLISQKDGTCANELLDQNIPEKRMPLFPGEEYIIEVRGIRTGHELERREFCVTAEMNEVTIQNTEFAPETREIDFYVQAVSQLLSARSGLDEAYVKRINIYSDLTGQPLFLKQQRARLRGGRLEYLIYQMLRILENEGKIDSVIWNGSEGEFGISNHAPPGRGGDSDIHIRIGDIHCPLELTTIANRRTQWSAEGVSVHDHVSKYSRDNPIRPNERIIGIFSAPEIHAPLVPSLEDHSRRIGIPIVCRTIDDLIDLFVNHNKEEIISILINKGNEILRRSH